MLIEMPWHPSLPRLRVRMTEHIHLRIATHDEILLVVLVKMKQKDSLVPTQVMFNQKEACNRDGGQAHLLLSSRRRVPSARFLSDLSRLSDAYACQTSEVS